VKRQSQSDFDDLEDLLWRVEQALEDPEDEYIEETDETFGEDFDEEPMQFQNYANNYGAAPSAYAPSQPQYREPAYCEEEEEDEDVYEAPPPVYRDPQPRTAPKKRRRHRGGCGCGCLTSLILMVALIVAGMFLLIRPPKSDDAIGPRKRDTATILICGTDEDGTRTDTMMLMYLSGSEKQVRLLSLPRDSYTITSSGKAAKLNSAFGRNGCGEEGMEVLMDYVADIIGYRPDGYVLVDFTLVPQIVDLMGGVDFDVPMDMDVASVAIQKGYQHLSGKQLMTLLRFRKGYANADLGRVEVQREVLKACIDQWLKPANIGSALQAVTLLENNSISSLNTSNYVWVAKTLLLSLRNFGNDTLPGRAEYRNDVSYYILNKNEVAEMINTYYNPYQVTITAADLNIAG